MSILLKRGVCGDLDPIMEKALKKIHRIYQAYGEDLIITSIRDGTHGESGAGSLHYIGRAIDCRKGKVPIYAISSALGADFDCIDENLPPHYHIEYDPK